MIEIEVYYRLTGIPFDKSIKSDQIFLSASARELLSRLEYMKQHRGLMLISGEPGTGKTTILRSFVDGLSQLSYQSFYVPLSTVNILDFYRQLNYHLGGQPLHLKSTLFRSIQKAIKDFVTHSKKIPLIVFDEAHLFKNENFFELQIITNFNMDSTDPAIFVLAAQSHLRDRLARSFLNSFNQRIQLKYHLVPLQKEEVESYLSFSHCWLSKVSLFSTSNRGYLQKHRRCASPYRLSGSQNNDSRLSPKSRCLNGRTCLCRYLRTLKHVLVKTGGRS